VDGDGNGNGDNDEAVRERGHSSRRTGCIKRRRSARHWMREGRPEARRSCQRDEQQARAGRRTEGGCRSLGWVVVGARAPRSGGSHWLPTESPCRPRLPCHSSSRGTTSELLDDEPAAWFLRFLYIRTLHGSRSHVFLAKKARLQP
jgi:hypothetical protein